MAAVALLFAWLAPSDSALPARAARGERAALGLSQELPEREVVFDYVGSLEVGWIQPRIALGEDWAIVDVGGPVGSESGGAIDGVAIIDIADPARPALAGDLRFPARVSHVAADGAMAFAAYCVEGSPSSLRDCFLDRIRASRSQDPVLQDHIALGTIGQLGVLRALAAEGSSAYLMPRLYLIDLEPATGPRLVGRTNVVGQLGRSVVIDPRQLLPAGRRHVYVSSMISGHDRAPFHLQVIDVTTAAAPESVARLETAQMPFDMALDGGQLYLMLYNRTLKSGAAVAVVDVTDPLRPKLLGELGLDDQLVAIAAARPFVYVLTESGRVLIVDVSDPARSRLVGRFDSSPPASGIAARGDLVYLTSEHEGLWIFRPRWAPKPTITPTPAATESPTPTALPSASPTALPSASPTASALPTRPPPLASPSGDIARKSYLPCLSCLLPARP